MTWTPQILIPFSDCVMVGYFNFFSLKTFRSNVSPTSKKNKKNLFIYYDVYVIQILFLLHQYVSFL